MKWMAPLAALLVSCSSSVPPTNPFDSQTPPNQQAPGSVRGLVDPAVVPGGGETVRLRGAATTELTTVADSTGAFVFSSVQPGTWSLELRVTGFETLILPGVAVAPGQTVDLGRLVPVDNRPTQAASVALTAVNPISLPGTLSCGAAVASPCQVLVTLTADDNPTQLQLSADPTFTGATWTAVPAGAQPWVIPFTMPAGPDGSTWLFVRFRDAAGNVSAPFLGEILRKSSAPTATALGFPSLVPFAGGGYYTNQLPLAVATQATGATRMRVSCDVTQPLASQPWVSYNTSQTCVLVAGDGTKTIGADFMDDAGNVASTTAATVWLQQAPPAAAGLTISTASGDAGSRTLVTGPSTATTSSAHFVVQVAPAAAASPLFARLEAWSSFGQPAVIAAGSGSVDFTLYPGTNFTDSSNQLFVRVIDRAGNAGPASSVTIAQERALGPLPPSGISLFTRPGSVQVSWTASPSTYATGYLLAYGPTTAYGGAGADQGASPVQVGNPCDASGSCRYVLTGLSNFEPEYFRLTSLSALQAGESAAAGPVTPQPVGLAAVGAVPLGGTAYAVAVADDRAYVVVANGLQIVDLSNPAAPALLGKGTFDPGGTLSAGTATTTAGLELRWPNAYVGGADGLYVFDISGETGALARRGKYATPRPVTALALRYPRAYLNVAGTYPTTGTTLLDVVDVSLLPTPARINSLASASYGGIGGGYQDGALAVVGDTVYFGTLGNDNLMVASVAGVSAVVPPAWIAGSSVHFTYETHALVADPGPRRYVYAMEALVGTLRIVDSTAPGAPVVLATVPGLPAGVFALAGTDVYLASGGSLVVLDTADPTNPRIAGTLALPATVGNASAVAVSGGTVVVVGDAGLAVLRAQHLQYPQARGQTLALGNLSGGARIELRGRTAIVPGNGLALYDTNPAAPKVTASNQGIFASGGDYALGYGFAGGLAVSGDLVFSAFGTQANSGAGLMAFRLGTYAGTCPGPTCVPCATAQRIVSTVNPNPTPRYFGLAVQGGYLYAARGSPAPPAAAAPLLDVYDVAAFTGTACAYGAPFAAAPAPAASFALLGEPRDVQVHRRYAFVAEADGLEILDLASPLAPARLLRQGVPSVISAVSARLGTCGVPAAPCYRIHLATDAGVRVFSWKPTILPAAVTDLATLPTPAAASAVLASFDGLVAGASSTGGLGFYDATAATPLFQSYSTPQPAGGVQAIGAAGRYVFANDNGAFVVQELQ